MMRRALSILSLLCCLCVGAQHLTADSAMRILSTLPLTDVEGIWQLSTDGGVVMICRDDLRATAPSAFSITLISSPDRARRPGTLLGTLSPTAQPGKYDARIFTRFTPSGKPKKQKRYTLCLEDAGHLSFLEAKSGLRISPIILFPHIFRRGIKIVDTRPSDLDGCIKIYPRVPIKGMPRYL